LAFAIVVLAFAANVVAMQYTRSALAAATAAGARTGGLLGGTAALCEARAEEALRGEHGLLRGPYAADARVLCARSDGVVVATATVTARWWVDLLPPITIRVSTDAVTEDLPGDGATVSPPSSGSSRSGS
jgi:hypothetical protein